MTPDPPSPASPKAAPIQVAVGFFVMMALMGVVLKATVGWARDFGILPYTGPIVETAASEEGHWDPEAPGIKLRLTTKLKRGRDRYSECRFRARVLAGDSPDASILATYESFPAGNERGFKSTPLAGENVLALEVSSFDAAATDMVRGGRVLLVVDELRGGEVVQPGVIRTWLSVR